MRGYAVLPFRQPSPPCDLFTYEAVKFPDICPKGKLWLFGRRHLQMWVRCLSWEFQEFQVINLSDLHPCQACRKEPKSSLRLISKLNSIHTSTGAFYQLCMGSVRFVPSSSFLCLEQQDASLLSLQQKKMTVLSYLMFILVECCLAVFFKNLEEASLMREMSQLHYSVKRMNIFEYYSFLDQI